MSDRWRQWKVRYFSSERGSAGYLSATLAALAATVAMLPVRSHLGVLNVLLIYLIVSFVSALILGAGPAALSVVASFLAFNFFFIPPFHTLRIADSDHLLALIVYLAIAIVTGQLVHRVRSRSQAAAALAQSDALKSALLTAVSHDLRTPLAAIKASATSLLDTSVDWDEAARSEFLKAINEETDRLSAMVNDLLDLSRIEGGALVPDKQWYDIAELIEGVTDRHAASAANSDHRISVEIEENLPLAHVDYLEISQALTNLVENSVKHTPPGTEIRIGSHLVPGALALSVENDGPTVPRDELGRIFDPFYRADAGARISGTGLGLAIAKGFVEAHGGRIWAESLPERGIAFRILLPLEHHGAAIAATERTALS